MLIEVRAQGVVALNDVVDRLGEGDDVQGTVEAKRKGHVKAVPRPFHPILEPRGELRVGQREPLRANRFDEFWAARLPSRRCVVESVLGVHRVKVDVELGTELLDQRSRQSGRGGRIEHGANGQLYAEFGTDLRDQPSRQQGMATQPEE